MTPNACIHSAQAENKSPWIFLHVLTMTANKTKCDNGILNLRHEAYCGTEVWQSYVF